MSTRIGRRDRRVGTPVSPDELGKKNDEATKAIMSSLYDELQACFASGFHGEVNLHVVIFDGAVQRSECGSKEVSKFN